MKYKRKTTNVSKYVSSDSNAPKPKTAAKKAGRKATAAVMIITVLFTLTRLGVVENDAIKRIITSSVSGNDVADFIKNEHAKEFIAKVGSLTREFCFGYLRSGDENTTAYAKPAAAPKKVPVAVNSDAALAEAEPDAKQPPEEAAEAVKNEFVFAPVIPNSGEITSHFGERIHPISNEKTNHNGIDIACSEGEDVLAAFEGTVEKAQYNEYSGNFVVIRHEGGFTSSYAHLSSLAVSEGQSVQTGSVIGKSGSTGMATGPHLHFEIRINGEAVNPFEYIR